jgi:4'-phosphopantetheinyl transferase
MALRTVSQLTDTAQTDVVLGKTPQGAPWAQVGKRRIALSLSHTEGLLGVLASDAADCALGLDLEALHRFGELETGALEMLLSRGERALLGPRPDPTALARLWVLKEAWVKALGTGFTATPARYDTTAPHAAGWAYRFFDPGHGHIGALALCRYNAANTDWKVTTTWSC